MALLTIVEASKQFKIARSYLYKKINEGELSTQLNENGTKVIQYVDLVRIFGENNATPAKTIKDSPQHVTEDNRGQGVNTTEDKQKTNSEDIIILLKEQISELKKDKESISKRLDDMSSKHDKLLLLIEHKAFSHKDNEDSPQHVAEDKRGQEIRATKDNKKTSIIICLAFFIILLIILIVTLWLRFTGII